MSEHELDLYFDWLEQRHWSSVVINSRVLTLRDMHYSLNSSLTWKSDNNQRRLVSESSIRGTLQSLQKWYVYTDGSGIFTCKPLVGSCVVDIMGQSRTEASTKANKGAGKKSKLPFIASDDKIFIQTEDLDVLVFDKDGYICHDFDDLECFSKKQEILKQSSMTEEFGKFFLMASPTKNNRDVYTLIQCNN